MQTDIHFHTAPRILLSSRLEHQVTLSWVGLKELEPFFLSFLRLQSLQNCKIPSRRWRWIAVPCRTPRRRGDHGSWRRAGGPIQQFPAAQSDHRQDGGMAVGWRQTGDKVQRYVGPWAVGYRQRVEKTSRSLMGDLVLTTDRTGPHKLTGVLLQRGPPEAPLDYVSCTLNPRVAGEVGVVRPLEDVWAESSGDKQTVGRAGGRKG